MAVLCGFVPTRRRGCPGAMVSVDNTFCMDVYEASLVEVVGHRTRTWSAYVTPTQRGVYRAVSRRGVVPQGYISQVQARAACAAAGKRLCTEPEWVRACKGPSPTTWPYGADAVPGRCNDNGVNPVPRLYHGGNVFHDPQMNDPRLNTLPQTVTHTGERSRCRGRNGIFDLVGNLHEWVEATAHGHGVFRGGFYADVHINGHGCDYATRAHGPTYHDYSTGFRCCANPRLP
jgi:formylglycine-generating enzyme